MPEISDLGPLLRARRRERRLSLRDVADQIGVSPNTLSRVERGHVPDLKNFQRIVDWLEMPAELFLESEETASTPNVISRHLLADTKLSPEAAAKISAIVEEMYGKLASEHPPIALHLRSAKMFTPAAGTKLAEILRDMQSSLETDR